MRLCMQDEHIGPKTLLIAPANMAILTPPIITKIVVNNLVFQLGLHLPTLNLSCFTRKNVRFLLVYSPSKFLDFYGRQAFNDSGRVQQDFDWTKLERRTGLKCINLLNPCPMLETLLSHSVLRRIEVK
jgi:hypothetical protein